MEPSNYTSVGNWKKDYPSFEDFAEESLNQNSSYKKMLHLIGENKRVIDFGCATGYLAKLLNQKGCIVTGVDINPDAAKVAEEYCDQVVVADLDFVSITERLPKEEFDVAIFGDVLEHLRNPWRILEETKSLLKSDGYVVASIPNIAHGAVRLALLQGRFEYEQFGILDNTHLRFFTRDTVEELFDKSGYLVEAVERTKHPIFFESTAIPKVNINDFKPEILQEVETSSEAETLQFVIRAFPQPLTAKNAVLSQRCSQLSVQLKQTQAELERTQRQLHDTQLKVESLQLQLHDTQTELARLQLQLHDTQTELARLQLQLHDTQTELTQAKTMITAMESSKFWQLRTQWLNLKNFLKIKKQD